MQSAPSKPRAPKPQEKSAQALVTKPSAPKPSTPKPSVPKPSVPISSAPKSLAPPPKPQEKPVQKQVMKPMTANSSSSPPAATSSEAKSSTPPAKTLVTAERATLPSPSKIITVPSASEGSGEFDDETLQAIIRNKQERVAQASGSAIPLAMDPKVLLDYINIWYEDPNTPVDDLKLPPGISHMVTTFINEAKWKEQQTRQAKVAKIKKEKFLKQNLLELTPNALVTTQAELKKLTDKYAKLSDRKSLKRNFIKLATSAVDDYNKKAAPRAPTPQPFIEEPADESPHDEETPQAEEVHQERRVDEPAIEEIIMDTLADEFAAANETATDPAASSKQADDSVPAGSSIPAEESVERTPSPKASKVKKMISSASDVKKTRAAEKEAKKRKVSSAEEEIEAKRLKALEETAPLDPVPLNVAPSYEMVIIDDPAKKADEEMKDAASEEHNDEEIQIDDSPQPFISQTDNVQASAAPADETACATKRAEEKQTENPQADEIHHSEQNPQDEEQADPTPPTEQEEEIPQPEAQPEQAPQPDAQQAPSPQPEVPTAEIPHPEENAEENHLNKTMHLSCSTQRLPLLSPLLFLSKIFSQFSVSHSPSVQSFKKKISLKNASIPCLEPVLSVLHDEGLLPMCSDISDWNNELILQFYATLYISGNPEDINTWVFDWMSQNTHYKAPASELLRELPIPIPSDEAVKLYGERELPNGMMEVLMKPLAEGKSPRRTFLVHELKYTPRSVYKILCSVLAPIKGHDDEEDVVGLMKNILFNIIHGIPINIHDFFLRTLADNAMCPFDHKIYAPWIMRFIRTRTGINFHADFQNHVGYMPPIRVNKRLSSPLKEKANL
ncbi:hypothetical protein ZWY2020_024951 [Hordeum vulgare]|nr:hypothetical protein ZWY2020_024951 [Hordeum vulgare]